MGQSPSQSSPWSKGQVREAGAGPHSRAQGKWMLAFVPFVYRSLSKETVGILSQMHFFKVILGWSLHNVLKQNSSEGGKALTQRFGTREEAWENIPPAQAPHGGGSPPPWDRTNLVTVCDTSWKQHF